MISLPEKQSSTKSTKAQAQNTAQQSALLPVLWSNRYRQKEEWDAICKEETAWFWRSPGRACISWESGNAPCRGSPCPLPQPPTGAHAFSSSCSSSTLLFSQYDLPHFYLQRRLHLGSMTTSENKPTCLSVPRPTSGTAVEASPLCSIATGLVSVLLSLSLLPPLQQNTMGNPGECQVNTLAVIHRFAIIRELCSSELFIKGMPQR